jgi:hypothetical protein
MAENDFVEAVGPDGNKRLVPEHYIDNPAFGFKLPPSARVKEPAKATATVQVEEPAATATTEQVTEPAAAGETKEARK